MQAAREAAGRSRVKRLAAATIAPSVIAAWVLVACGPHEDVTPMVTVQPGAAARAMALMGELVPGRDPPRDAGSEGDGGEEEADESGRLVFACMESFGAIGALARLPCVATLLPMADAADAGPVDPPAPTTLVAPDGKVSVDLVPGRYRVTVSREPDYTTSRFDVDVVADGKTWGPNEGAVVLARILDTHGYLAAEATPYGFGEGDARRMAAAWLTRESKQGDPLDLGALDDVQARSHAVLDVIARLAAKSPVTPVASGAARTYVRVDNATQALAWEGKREADFARGVRERRDVVLSNGPFLRVTARGANAPKPAAPAKGSKDAAPPASNDVPVGGIVRPSRAREVVVTVHVECAAGVTVDRISILRVHGTTNESHPVTLRAPPQAVAGTRVADVTVHLRATTDDAFVVTADGTTPAFAMTAPIWIDANGDGESLGRKTEDIGEAMGDRPHDKPIEKKTP